MSNCEIPEIGKLLRPFVPLPSILPLPPSLSPIFCEGVVQAQENKPRLSEDEPIPGLEDFRTLSRSPKSTSFSSLLLLFSRDPHGLILVFCHKPL